MLVAGLPGGCGSSSQPPETSEREAGGPVQVIRDLELRETTAGALEWVLRARRAVRGGATEPTRLESLKVDFYQGSDAVRSILTADSGSVDSRKGTLVARGNVLVRNPEGDRLETEELFWDRKNGRVQSDRFVRFVHGGDILTGIGFRSDPNLDHYQILRDVRATVREGEQLRDEFLEPFGADSVGGAGGMDTGSGGGAGGSGSPGSGGEADSSGSGPGDGEGEGGGGDDGTGR